jgi:DNA-3-methyladenine glycosylase II
MRLVSWASASHKALVNDKLLGKTVRKVGPPQIRIGREPFELLVHCVAGQQLSGKAADAITRKLTQTIGSFSPDNLADRSHDELRLAGLSGAKARTILELSRAAMNGLDFKKMRKMGDAEIAASLTSLWGIGPWTVEMFLIFGLGRPDVHSAGDLGLRKGLQIVHRLPAVPSAVDAEGLFERWKPYRSAACWYLWRVVEGENSNW